MKIDSKISKKITEERVIEMCEIIEKLQNCFEEKGIDQIAYSPSELEDIKKIKHFFNVETTFEVVLVCHFIVMKLSIESSISIANLVNKFKLNIKECVTLNISISKLIRRNILSTTTNFRDNEKRIKLSNRSFQAFLNYDTKIFKNKQGVGFIDGLIKEVDSITSNYCTDDAEDFLDSISQITELYSHTPEIKWIKDKKLELENIAILLLTIREHIIYGNPIQIEKVVSYIAEEAYDKYRVEKGFFEQTNELINKELIKFELGDFMGDRIKLTPESINFLCKDFKTKHKVFKSQIFKVIEPSKIKDENYEHNNDDLKLIEKMVSKEGYKKISEKVKRMTIALIGKPGVGKSSFINHLAKITNRTLCTIDISNILSCYVGQSEERLVQMFREIEKINTQIKNGPCIVAIDEFNSFAYKRIGNASSSASQMSNNIISLLLMELDKFNGILICCSNFGFEHFDEALKRRFHMICEIKSPTKNTILKIFNNYFPELSPEKGIEYLKKYEHISITPAIIKHIRSKVDVDIIFNDETDIWKSIITISNKEFKNDTNQRIGFNR